jgi:hypothetical protein
MLLAGGLGIPALGGMRALLIYFIIKMTCCV